MRRIPSVKAVMTAFPHAVDTSTTLSDAMAIMEKEGIGYLFITNGAEPAGVVSRRDLYMAWNASGTRGSKTLVGTLCTPAPYVVDVSERLDTAVTEMAQRQISTAMITKENRVVGILTMSDLLRHLGELLLETYGPPPQGGDAA